MSKDDYRIWSNADLDYEEWKDWMEEEYPTLSEDDRIAMMYEENGHYLEDDWTIWLSTEKYAAALSTAMSSASWKT